MDTIFMNSKDSKTWNTHRLIFSLTGTKIWKMSDKYVALSNKVKIWASTWMIYGS